MAVQEGEGCEETKARGTLLVQTSVTMRNKLYACVASFGRMLKGRFGPPINYQVLDTIKD